MEIVLPQSSLGSFSICPEHRRLLDKIILHEAGHYVIARTFGFKADQIKICFLYQGGQYNCYVTNSTARKLPNQAEIERFLEERILILFSGTMAEALSEGRVDSKTASAALESEGGSNDEGKISELIHLLNNIRHANLDDAEFKNAPLAINSRLKEKAKDMVETEQAVISKFAKELSSKVESGGEEYIFSEEEIESLLAEAYKT